MTRSTAVLVDEQITQLCDHRGLGHHFLAIAPNGGSGHRWRRRLRAAAGTTNPSQGNMDGSEPSWRARGETGCVGALIRLPLRVLLPCVAVCLAASGAAAIGAVCVRAVGGYVIRQADDGLRACASSMLSHGQVAVPASGAVPGQAPHVPCDMELLSVSGQVLIPAPAGAGGPAIPASGSWLAAHPAGPVTVPC